MVCPINVSVPYNKDGKRCAILGARGVCLTLLFLLSAHAAWALAERPPSQDIALAPVLTRGLVQPVFIGHAGDHSDRLFIVEQPGRIRILRNGSLQTSAFLDISDRVDFGGEMGLLGLAFHPRFAENGRFFVNYTRNPDGATVVAEYRVSQNSDHALRDEQTLMVIPQPYSNHNGGMVAFGPDGYLYIATGDGGAGGDPGNRGQNPNTLLGKMLRIDVDQGDPYGIPPDNPFAKQQSGREIFALGFRNPWRFSFDRQTGRLWAADVGQNQWEEIDVVEAGEQLWLADHGRKPLLSASPGLQHNRADAPRGGISQSITLLCRHGRIRVSGKTNGFPTRHLRVRGLLQRPDHGPARRTTARPSGLWAKNFFLRRG